MFFHVYTPGEINFQNTKTIFKIIDFSSPFSYMGTANKSF